MLRERAVCSDHFDEPVRVLAGEQRILVEREKEPELYGAIWAEAQRLIRISEEIRVSVERVRTEQVAAEPKRDKREPAVPAAPKVPERGFCIGCRAPLPLDPAHPYCRDCYAGWKAKKDDRREEKHCHVCGVANKSSLVRPACYDCHRKYKGKPAFAE